MNGNQERGQSTFDRLHEGEETSISNERWRSNETGELLDRRGEETDTIHQNSTDRQTSRCQCLGEGAEKARRDGETGTGKNIHTKIFEHGGYDWWGGVEGGG